MAATASQSDAGSTAQARVLIVDDHPVVRHGLAQILSDEQDLSVCGEADCPQDALSWYEQTSPDLVIVDLSLKNGSGLELIKDLKARYRNVRILVTSVHDEGIYAERVLHAGGLGYVGKSASASTFLEAVRRVLVGQVFLSEQMKEQILVRSVEHESDARSPVGSLSDRELEVFELLGRGMTSAEIARQLEVKQKTVETYREKIKKKLRIDNANLLILHAVRWMADEPRAQVRDESLEPGA